MFRKASVWLVSVLLTLLSWPATAVQPATPQRPNISGKWQENLKASRWSDGRDLSGDFTRHAMTIEYAEPRLKIVVDVQTPNTANSRVLAYELQTDGRVYEFELQGERALGYAYWEGPALTVYTKRALPGGGFLEVRRTMTLQEDGRRISGSMRFWAGEGSTAEAAEVWERQ